MTALMTDSINKPLIRNKSLIMDYWLCPKGEHCDVRAVPQCYIFYVCEATSWSSLFPPSMHFVAAPLHNNKLQLRRGETTRKTPFQHFFAPKQCHVHGSAWRLFVTPSVREKTKPKCQSSSFKPDLSSDWDFVRRKKNISLWHFCRQQWQGSTKGQFSQASAWDIKNERTEKR